MNGNVTCPLCGTLFDENGLSHASFPVAWTARVVEILDRHQAALDKIAAILLTLAKNEG